MRCYRRSSDDCEHHKKVSAAVKALTAAVEEQYRAAFDGGADVAECRCAYNVIDAADAVAAAEAEQHRASAVYVAYDAGTVQRRATEARAAVEDRMTSVAVQLNAPHWSC